MKVLKFLSYVAIGLLALSPIILIVLGLIQPTTIKIKTAFPQSTNDTVWTYDPYSRAPTNETCLKPMNANGRWTPVTPKLP